MHSRQDAPDDIPRSPKAVRLAFAVEEALSSLTGQAAGQHEVCSEQVSAVFFLNLPNSYTMISGRQYMDIRPDLRDLQVSDSAKPLAPQNQPLPFLFHLRQNVTESLSLAYVTENH